MDDACQIIELANGARLIAEKMEGLKSASVGVWVNVGTRSETKTNNGVAHLLEHLVFKGAGVRDAKQLAEDADSHGVYLNAATSYEKTGFYARCLADESAFALNLCADLVLEPTLDEADIALEKNVVLSEIKEANDDAEDRASVLNQSASFKDQALGMPILGDEASLMAITSNQIATFHAQYKNPKNLIIAISGAFDFDEILEHTHARFGELKAIKNGKIAEAIPTSGIEFEARKIEQFQISLSTNAANNDEENLFINRIFCSILGGGMSSRLFQDLREKRGLVYGIDAYDEKYHELSRIGIGAGCASKNAEEVIKRINGHIEDIAQKGPTCDEMVRAKKVLETSIMMALENPSSRMSSAVNQVLRFGKHLTIEDISQNIRSTTAQNIKDIANIALKSQARAASAVGANFGEKSLDSFLN